MAAEDKESDSVTGLRQRRDGPVMVLELAAPPRNALNPALRAALRDALIAAIADDEVQGIVLCGAGGQFSTGLDLEEIGHERAPTVADLCLLIEDSPKCVVAAVHGLALGGGMELALAAHWRFGDPAARFGLPELAIGLVPCAGATQRLPRLVGGEQAVRMVMAGESIGAAEALAIGLIDRVVDTGLDGAAVQMAQTASARRTGGIHVGLRDGAFYQNAMARARGTLVGEVLQAPARALDCLEAAQLLPFAQGLEYERAAMADLVVLPETAGLMRTHQASARAMALPAALAGTGATPLEAIAILGAGGEGLALAGQALARGLQVTLVDPDRDRLVAGLGRIAAAQEMQVTEGRLSTETRDADWARLTPGTDIEALDGAVLLVAAPDMPVPQGRAVVTLGALDLRGQGVALSLPTGPARMAELALGGLLTPGLALSCVALIRRMGWRFVVTGPGGLVEDRLRRTLTAAVTAEERAGRAPGLIAAALATYGLGTPQRAGLPPGGREGEGVIARCLLALANEGARMIGEGTARCPAVIDAIATASGLLPRHRGGPMFQADRRGLLIVRAALSELAGAEPDLFTLAPLFETLLRDGQTFADLDRG